MICSLVPKQALNQAWLDIIHLVRKFIPHAHGRATELSIYQELVKNICQLWVAFDENDGNKPVAFVVTRINEWPARKMLTYEYIGAEDNMLGSWFDDMSQLTERYAKELGLDGVESVGRPGWEKILKKMGWQRRFVVYERMFSEEEMPAQEVMEQ